MREAQWHALYNAGIFLCPEAAGPRLLVDALEEGYPPYAPAPASVLDIEADALLFTHRHPDHYSLHMAMDYMNRYPHCRLYGPPETCEPLLRLHMDAARITALAPHCPLPLAGWEHWRLTAWPTRHMGAEFRHKEHVSLLLESAAGTRILFAGDAAPVFNSFTHAGAALGHVDCMVAPYVYALYEPAQRMFTRSVGTDCLLVNHIPEPDREEVRAQLRALPEGARPYRIIVTEQNTKAEV